MLLSGSNNLFILMSNCLYYNLITSLSTYEEPGPELFVVDSFFYLLFVCSLIVVSGSVWIWFQQSPDCVEVFRDAVREQRRPADTHRPRTDFQGNL